MRVSISPHPADWFIRFLNLCKSERGRTMTACLNLPLPVRKVQRVLVLGCFCFFFFEFLFYVFVLLFLCVTLCLFTELWSVLLFISTVSLVMFCSCGILCFYVESFIIFLLWLYIHTYLKKIWGNAFGRFHNFVVSVPMGNLLWKALLALVNSQPPAPQEPIYLHSLSWYYYPLARCHLESSEISLELGESSHIPLPIHMAPCLKHVQSQGAVESVLPSSGFIS